jgi:integrator complex subunit 7
MLRLQQAASSPSSSLQFQIEYLRLRSEMLVAFCNFLISCNSLQLSPPAEIASTIATVMRDELLKSGRIVTQVCFSK